MKKSGIYDFETLSQDVYSCAVVVLAVCEFDESRFVTDPYEYDELIDMCSIYKFDVEEQVKSYNRKVSLATVDWWKKQGADAQRFLRPCSDDISVDRLHSIFTEDFVFSSYKSVYTRSNTFDPIILQTLLKEMNKEVPYPWWVIRDTRSIIDGMAYGTNISNKFVPDDVKDLFVAHDPAHDISMDIYRIQFLAQILSGDDNV